MKILFEQLLYESGLTAQGCWDQLDAYDREAITRFAELIVKECADTIATDKKFSWLLDAPQVAEDLKQHFRVE